MEHPLDRRVMTAIEAMEAHLSRRWRVADLAALCRLSPSRFAHVFRATMGTSPLRHLQERRLERARDLLQRTSLSVQEVMTLVGATDPSHFSRDFRNRVGVSPRDYRREHHLLSTRSGGSR